MQTFLSGRSQEPFIINVELFYKRHIYADIFILCVLCIPSKIMPEKNHLQVLTMPTFYYKALFIVMNLWIINYYAIGYQRFVAGIYYFNLFNKHFKITYVFVLCLMENLAK